MQADMNVRPYLTMTECDITYAVLIRNPNTRQEIVQAIAIWAI